jgi:hypothetical protein
MLRPIDIKNALVQSDAMERVQQSQQQRPDQKQRYVGIQVKEEKKFPKDLAKNSGETERARVQEKNGKEQEESRRHASPHPENGKDDAQGTGNEPQDEDDEHGALIDIRV